MPFLGKDWRSSGEQWVKTDDGWERIKSLETVLKHMNIELKKESRKKRNDAKRNQSVDNDEVFNEDEQSTIVDCQNEIESKKVDKKQPCVFLHLKSNILNRECNNSPKPTMSEILNGLDMVGAAKDMRRFNFVYKLVQFIINEKLRQISGNAQRTLFLIVRVMFEHAVDSKENINQMRKLLVNFKTQLNHSYYYFYYIGTQKAWERHRNTINKWLHILDSEINCLNETKAYDFSLYNLPNDCKLEILRRLNTGLDLVNLSKCNRNLYDIISTEIQMWKNLCLYHFQQSNINSILKKENDHNCLGENLDWKALYFRLTRRYGHREVYVDMIHRCLHCKCLFWKEIGHPCFYIDETTNDSKSAASDPITPYKLMNLILT